MIVFGFILVVLASVSIANIITEEYVFKWLRNLIIKTNREWLITLFHCVTCMSFWCGLFVGLIWYGPCTIYPLLTALVASLTGKFIKLFEE